MCASFYLDKRPIIERKHCLRKDSAPERMKIKNYAYELQLEL